MATLQAPLKSFTMILGRLFALCILLSVSSFPTSTFATDILLGTEAAGTFSHFAGRAICRVINRHADGLNCQTVPALDSVHNLTNLQGGSLDMALVDGSLLYDAINKKGSFAFLDIRYDNLGYVTSVYDQAILLVTRSDADIDTLDQLKGKRINAGAPLSETNKAMELIFETKGWTEADFKVVEALPSSQSQDTMAFCHGSVQAMVTIGVHPDSALLKLMKLCSAMPVSMDDPDIVKMIVSHPGYSKMIIPPKIYPELDQPVTTFGKTVSLVASGSLDDETVQTIMAVMDAQQSILKNSHPAMGNWKAEKTELSDIGLSYHPGAAAYLSLRE